MVRIIGWSYRRETAAALPVHSVMRLRHVSSDRISSGDLMCDQEAPGFKVCVIAHGVAAGVCSGYALLDCTRPGGDAREYRQGQYTCQRRSHRRFTAVQWTQQRLRGHRSVARSRSADSMKFTPTSLWPLSLDTLGAMDFGVWYRRPLRSLEATLRETRCSEQARSWSLE